jgi:hypothetical protein
LGKARARRGDYLSGIVGYGLAWVRGYSLDKVWQGQGLNLWYGKQELGQDKKKLR